MDGRRLTNRRAARVLAALAVLAIGLVACGGADDAATAGASDQGDADYGRDVAESPTAAPSFGGDEAATDDAGDGEGSMPPSPPGGGATPPDGRQVIRTAELVLEVTDPADVSDRIGRIATAVGGYIAETDLQRDAQGVVRGSIVVRVPSGALLATVEELDELAVAVPVRRIDESDVTGEVVDLRAQVANLTAYERELRTLLTDVRERTSRTDDLLQVFERIREVRAELDRAEARLGALDELVSLSTITIELVPAPSTLPVTDPTWQPSQTVRDALATTAAAFTALADVAIHFVLTFLPIVVVLAGPVTVLLLLLRRRGRRTPVAPVGPPAPESSTGDA